MYGRNILTGTAYGFFKIRHFTQSLRRIAHYTACLSRSMKKLENEFGVSLFNRSKSKITLNETGKVSARYAEKVLESDREMFEKTVTFDRSMRTKLIYL